MEGVVGWLYKRTPLAPLHFEFVCLHHRDPVTSLPTPPQGVSSSRKLIALTFTCHAYFYFRNNVCPACSIVCPASPVAAALIICDYHFNKTPATYREAKFKCTNGVLATPLFPSLSGCCEPEAKSD